MRIQFGAVLLCLTPLWGEMVPVSPEQETERPCLNNPLLGRDEADSRAVTFPATVELAQAVNSVLPAVPERPATSTSSPTLASSIATKTATELFPKWFQPSVTIRGRFEMPSGINFLPGTTDGYYLSRMRMGLAIQPAPWLKFVGEVQDAREAGVNAPQQPASMYDPWDLRLAYIEAGGESARGVTVRVGRQEVLFGSGRLIATPDWGNLSRTFDGARLTIKRSYATADLFALSPALADASRVDRHKAGDELYGSFFIFSRLIPNGSFEPYVIERRQMKVAGEHGEIGNALLGTFGFRATGKLPLRLDYSVELAHQWGPYATDHINALAGVYIAGWTVNSSNRKPRFLAEYDHASGDAASKDGRRQTFDQMYPTNHGNYGIADMVGWRNMREVRGGFEFLATRKLKLQTDVMDFHLATTQDGLYNDGGTRIILNRTATSNHVGVEIDFQSNYQLSKKITLGAGFAHLFPGDYLKQCGKSVGYNYPYILFTARPF